MALICISASNRIRHNTYYMKKERMLLAQFMSEKKAIENNYRCDRFKLKAIKKDWCDELNLEVMKAASPPRRNSISLEKRELIKARCLIKKSL